MIFKQQDVKSLLGVNTDEIIQPFANAVSVIDEYNQHVQNGTLTTENFNNILQSCDESLANYLKNILGEEGSLTGYEVSLKGSFDSLMKINSVIQEFNNLDPSKQEDFATAVGLTNINLGNYLSGLNGANGSLIGYGVSLVGSTAKTIGLTLATTALNAALTFGISAIVTGVVTAFTVWINSSQKITEAAEDAKNKITSINDELKTNTETVDNVKQRYAELAQEVDNLGKMNQSRGTLSTDDYEEFLDLSNQLAGVFPQLTKGYDDNGNAILDLSGNVNTIVGSLDDLLQKEKDIANQKVMDEFPKVYKGYVKDLGDAQQEVKTAKKEFDELNSAYNSLGKGQSVSKGFDINGYSNEGESIGTYIANLEKLGLTYKKTQVQGGTVVQAVGDIDTAFTNKLEEAKKNLDYAQQQLEGQKSSIGSYLNTWLQTEFTYNSIDDSDLQNAVKEIVENFDFSNLPKDKRNDWNYVSEYLRRNILFAINDVQDDPEISKALSEVFTNQELTHQEKAEYLQQIKEYFDKTLGKNNPISIYLKPQIEDVNSFQKLYDKTVSRFEKAGSKSKKKNVAKEQENLQNEYKKISDWGLDDYADQIKNGTIQSKFGNVDMDKRTIIHWSDELKQTYADELASWDYDPEIGSIDTVFGGSQRFGEELNGKGWEVAFTPILPDGTFLSQDTVSQYINQILEKAYADDGKVTEDELTKIDAEGMKVGNTFVHGIFAGIDDSEEYDNNGNWAEVVGRLMHFSGDSGAVSLAKKGIEKAKKRFGQDDQSKIEKFLKSEGITSEDDIKYFNEVTEDATSAAEAIKKYNAAKKAKNEADKEDSTTQYGSFKEGWKALGNSTDDTFKDTQKDLDALAKAGELTAKTFHSTSGADKWAESFKELGLSTQDVIDRINQMQNSADQLSSMKTGISGIAQILGQKKSNLSSKKTRNDGIGADVLAGLSDEVKQNKKEYEEFCEVLGNGNSTMEDCRKASNKLASAYVNSSNFLAKLTPETKAYYTSVLDEMGVENASQVVKDTLAKKNELLAAKKKYLAEQGENVANAEAKDITKFAESKNYSDQLTNSLLLLAMRKKLVNGTQLNFDSDIGQIKSFVKAIGAQLTALNALQNWKRNQSKLQGMPEDVRQIKKQEYMKDAQKEVDAAVKKAEKGTKVKVDVTPDISNTGSGGNSKNNKSSKDKSKDSKQEIDWIARKLEVLQKAIDTTSGKLQNLFSIKAKKDNINKQITETTALLKANRKAFKAYTAEANKVKLGGKLKTKVRSGDYDITKYDSKTADKINKYQDLIDKAREAQDAVQDNIASISDLNQQKLDNITTWYDKLLEKINAVTSKLQAKSDLTAKVRGMLGQAETGTKTEYTDTLKNQKSALKTSQTELKKYEAERKAQRKKLTGQTNSKNKSDRQTTKEFLKRSGLSKKEIAKELKKFDTKRGKLKDKQLDDFDATTKSQSAKLKENVYSAMSEMLDTAQSLANIPLEKLSVTLDKLSTQFTVLENQASRAAKEVENAGTGLDYYTRKSQAQIDNKSSAQYKARLTKETAVSSRDAAANKLRAKGIDPSTIKTASDIKKLSSKDTDAMYWASQYLAGVSAVNDATSQLSSVQEDYASTVSSVTDNIIDERNKLYENERSRQESKHSNDEKEYDYTDTSLKDRLDTIDIKLDHQKTDTVDSIKKQADKSFGEAAHAVNSFYGYKTMGYLDSQPAWVQNAFNKAYTFMQKGYNFNPATDNISDAYISSDILEAIKQAVQDGYLPSTEYEQVVKYNANIADGNNQYQTYANNKATYDYETVPNSFKEIFSTISDDADRTVSDIQRNIDAVENSLDSDLFANKTESYKKEADYYADQRQVYVDEGDALRKQLALAEAKGLKQGSDTWNELMDQIYTADDNAEKAAQSYTNAIINAFNSIGDIADRKVTEIGKSLSKLDTQMSLYETQGHFITSEFYNGQGDLYQQQREAELKKATDLQAELDADVASGDIKEYSARWYEMKDKIDEATQSADDYSVKIAESTNKAFDAILQLGEKSREAITRMNDEADFYQDILGRDKLVNEKTGAFTANGVASISLSYEKMTNDIVDNNNIQREIEEAKKRYKNGNNPEYGIEKYNEDMDKLLSQQREAIKNYYDEREAVMSLISDGLQKQLDVLQDIVDKTKEAMDRTSDLRDYQNNVEEATKNISSLEKQLTVVQGNDSEEGRATAQSLQKQLEDAQKNLDDLEWDKKKTDMTNILDDLMENAQDYVDEKLDQVSDTLDEIRDNLKKDAPKVIETLQGLDNLWGTSMSNAFKNAVSTGDYSTITHSVDSAASKIAQAVYDAEKAILESTPKPVIKEPDQYNSKAEKLLNQYASKDVEVGTTRFETIFDQKMQDWKEGYHLSTDSARKMLKELTDYDVDGITDEFVHYMLIDTLKANHIGGFAKGGVIGALNEQVRKNNDDALISVQSGEGILTPQQTEMFQKLVGELPALVNIADVKVPNFPTTQNTSKTVNVELGDMHFDLPNVTDTDSFINAWKTDNKMKNFVSDVVAGAVTGNNSKAMRY